MYSDPNYHSLNHWNILQTLARKGVHVAAPTDCALTETVLIQTNPLKMVSGTADFMSKLLTIFSTEKYPGDDASLVVEICANIG